MKSIILTISILILWSNSAYANGWEKVTKKRGITIYKKNVSNANVVAFKGVVEIDATPGKILFVLRDNGRRKEWVDRLLQSRILETTSNGDQVLYQEYKAPWPAENRDLVFLSKLRFQKSTGVYILEQKSVNHPKAPKTIGVRAQIIKSSYTITPIKNGNTRLEVEILSDPKGDIPKWLVNAIQRSWPIKTLSSIKKQVKKSFVKEIKISSN